ncbi:hypothetical protein ACFPZP_16115 [Citrobacter bitternis]|uniref:Uncharacterized protein n=1 Tax=Citrobacter bitternis TaxID=1585982 RepID=A0ABW1Q2C2_9ENTR
MIISPKVVNTILQRLADVYPFMLKPDGYRELLKEIEENTLDGHLLYLWEKGMIDSQMNFNVHQEQWEINSLLTRITSVGIDYLDSQKTY